MMKTTLNVLLLAALFSAASCGDGNKTKDSKEEAKDLNEKKFDETSMEDDAQFVAGAYEGGMFEVEAGKLAQANGASQKVKELGKMMQEDHGMANEELKALAARKNISVPEVLGEKKMEKYNKLKGLKGADFDKEYADCMVDAHEKTLDKFEKEADKGKDAEIKTWASGKVAVIKHHLEMAKSTKDAVK